MRQRIIGTMKRLLLFVAIMLAIVTASCRQRPPQADRPPQAQRIGPAEFYWLMDRACWYGDELGVEMLLKAGTDPNGVRDYDAFNKSPYQFGLEPSWPINQAAYGGHAAVVRLLLKAGATPHAPEDEGQTALTIAAERGHLEVVRLLLEAGVDRSYRSYGPGGFVGTAEEIALRTGHQDVADAIRGFSAK
jgi:hypothetical protein